MKKHAVKRSLSIVLSVLMVLSCMTTILGVFASAAQFDWNTDEWATANGKYRFGKFQADDVQKNFSYQYVTKFDGENVYIGVKLDKAPVGTADAYGNGAGTNVRAWFYIPGSKIADVECTTYTHFVDVAYNGTDTVTRFLRNTNPTGNSAAVVEAWADTHSYTANGVVGESNYDVEIIIPKATFNFSETVEEKVTEFNLADRLEIILTVSTLDEGVNNALYSGTFIRPYSGWDSAGAIRYGWTSELPAFSENAVVDDNRKVLSKDKPIDAVYSSVISQYSGVLNDGISVAGTAFSYGAPWYSFYLNGTNPSTIDPATRIGYATIDLGAGDDGQKIGGVRMQVAPGIGACDSIKVYASKNNVDWLECGTLTYTGTDIQWIELVFDYEIDARYIKAEFHVPGMFFMVSEIEVFRCYADSIIELDRANSYDWTTFDFPTLQDTAISAGDVILATGSSTDTVADVIGGAYFTWWIAVLAQWNGDKECFEIIDIDYSGSTDKHEWTLGSKRFVFMGNYSYLVDAGKPEAANSLRYDMYIGMPLYLYGAETLLLSGELTDVNVSYPVKTTDDYFVCTATAADAGYFTDVDVPEYTSAENVGLGKCITDPGTTGYCGRVDDGIVPVGINYTTGPEADWYNFAKGTSVLFDLGATNDKIGAIRMYYGCNNAAGISFNFNISVMASNDGYEWLDLGVFEQEMTPIAESYYNNLNLTFEKYLAARYIKLTCNTTDKGHMFVGDIQIFELTEHPVSYFTDAFRYADDSFNLVSYTLGNTIGDVYDSTFEDWNLVVVGWDFTDAMYKVKEILIGEAGADYKSTVIPKYGFVIAAAQANPQSALASALNVGDQISLYDVVLSDVVSGQTFDNTAMCTVGSLGTKVAYAPKAISLLTAVGFAGGDLTIIPRVTNGEGVELTTIDDVAAYVRGVEIGDETDYNYYYMIVVDGEGLVTETNWGLGRPDHVKGATVIPEGGFCILANAANKNAALFQTILVADTITLIGTDLTSLSTITETQTFTNEGFVFGHVHVLGDKAVFPATCTEDGYDAQVCSSCNEIIKSNLVPALGHDLSTEITSVESTCTVPGYNGYACSRCDYVEKIEGTEKPLAPHVYTANAHGRFIDYECDNCDDFYYANADGETPVYMTAISHVNGYNWGTFASMIIKGEGQNLKTLLNYNPNAYTSFKVEEVCGELVVTEKIAAAVDKTAQVAGATGFILYVAPASNDCGSQITEIVANVNVGDVILTVGELTNGAVDTEILPPKGYLYITAAGDADYTALDAAIANAEALSEAAYTPESWAPFAAALEAAKAIEAGLKDYYQATINTATSNLLTASAALEKSSTVSYGNVDGQNDITTFDAVLILQYVAELIDDGGLDILAADVDGQNGVTTFDAVLVLQYVAELIDTFPAQA